MRIPRCPQLIVAGLACLLAWAVSPAAQAAGRWNTPSTPCQHMGFGFGPGYHAPYVLGRWWKPSAANPGVDRVGQPWRPPTGCCAMHHPAADYHWAPPAPRPANTYAPFGEVVPTAAEVTPAPTLFAPPAAPLSAPAGSEVEPMSPSEQRWPTR